MKKIILLFTITGMTLLGSAQDIYTNAGKTLLPAGYEKINREEAKSHINQHFHGNRGANIYTGGINPDYLYRVNNMIVVLNSKQPNEKQTSLISMKRGLDHMNSFDKTYKSALSTVNGNTILTTNTVTNGIGHYMIFADDADNLKHFTGSIQCNISDSTEAEHLVRYIIEHIKF